MNLLEAYSKRLSIAESYYSKKNDGAKMDNNRKIATAQCLKNINSFLSESFDNSVGTQKSDLGAFKKFALNLTTIAVPNLIANDLVIVHPMTSRSGYINYLSYTAGSDKGTVSREDTFNSAFGLYQTNNTNAEYTSSKVTASGTAAAAVSGVQTVPIKWTPVIPGTVMFTNTATSVTYYDKASDFGTSSQGTLYTYTIAPTREEVVDRNGNVVVEVVPGTGTGESVATGIVITYGSTGDGAYTATQVPAAISNTVATSSVTLSTFTLAYVYNNTYIPQNDIPLLNAHMDAIPLYAHARRVAVYYSQIDAFIAKTDYDFDLSDKLAEQAVGQLAYEIDTEIIQLVDTAAGSAKASLTWNRTIPVGVSKTEHYEGFSEVVAIGSQLIYDTTKRFTPNWMIIASNILPVLTFIKGFKAAPQGQMNGPYFAGDLNGIKVFVSPALASGRFLLGVLGNDMQSAVAVYAPYMTIVPTQLLQYADGGTSQGFSTLYDIKVLNKNLVVAGAVTGNANAFVGSTSTTPVYNSVIA